MGSLMSRGKIEGRTVQKTMRVIVSTMKHSIRVHRHARRTFRHLVDILGCEGHLKRRVCLLSAVEEIQINVEQGEMSIVRLKDREDA